MSSIERFNGASPVVSPLSKVGRELGRIASESQLAITATAGRAAIEAAKLDAAQAVTTQAMHSVAMVTQTEQQLAQAVPLAASRLQGLGDIHALAAAEIVGSLARRPS